MKPILGGFQGFPQSSCEHQQTTRATDVAVAVGPDGCLCGEERQKLFGVRPVQYDWIEFCSNRGCERVWRSERASS